MTTNPLKVAIKIVLVYATLSILSVLFSDQLSLQFFDNPENIALYQTAISIFFIAVTSIILFLLLYKNLNRYVQAHIEKDELHNQATLAMKATKTGTWSWTIKTNKTTWSDENYSLLGYEPGSIESNYKNWEKCIHKDDLENVKDQIETAIDAKSSLDFEYRVTHPDGTVHWLHDIGRMILSSSGEPIGMYGIQIDITDRKLFEEKEQKLSDQLRQSQKIEAVGRLAGGIAHDYNNMLSVIIGYTELAQMKINPSDSISADLKEILSAAERSTNITRQLLAFARKQTITPRLLDLNSTVGGMLNMLQRLIGEGIELAWLPKPDLWTVKIDPSQIDQILANMCINARDAITSTGIITIETDNITFDEAYCVEHEGFIPGDFVQIAISDNGCGMEKELLDNIFEPFFTTKASDRGTGLGLSTVYGIVKQNNGFINVYSEPNNGSTFKIYLLRHMGAAEVIETPPKSEIPSSQGETILLVEDEASILKLSERILTELGYNVLATGKPHDAIHIAQTYPKEIHLLITDVVMPKMNGRQLSEHLQAIHPGIKTLFMSGYTTNIIAHHGVLETGVHFIEKPFSRMGFGFKIRESLED